MGCGGSTSRVVSPELTTTQSNVGEDVMTNTLPQGNYVNYNKSTLIN